MMEAKDKSIGLSMFDRGREVGIKARDEEIKKVIDKFVYGDLSYNQMMKELRL